MRIYRPQELCLLADAWCAGTGKTQSALTDEMGVNDKLFRRLGAGLGCHSDTLMAASRWFAETWPTDTPWPETVDRPNVNSEVAEAGRAA